MKRSEFLGKIGIGAAFVLTSACLGSCTKDSTGGGAETDVDFTIDLSNTLYSNLTNIGGYIIIDNKYVIARATDSSYVAATRVCSHEDRKKIEYRSGEWFCTEHSAEFDLNGNGLNANGSKGLTIYRTSLTGTELRVYS